MKKKQNISLKPTPAIQIEPRPSDTPSDLIKRQMLANVGPAKREAERKRVAELTVGDKALELTAQDRRELNKADMLEMTATKGKKGAPAQRRQAAALRLGVERRLAERTEARALQRRLAEQAGQDEKARVPDRGPVILRSRDGLASLMATGSLTPEEVQVALAFRMCFEAAGASLQSGIANLSRGSRSTAADTDAAELRRTKLLLALNAMERAVGAAMEDGRELLVIRLVAGEGRTIRSITGGANSGRDVKAAYLAALKRALAAAGSARVRKGVANQPR